MGKWRTPFMCKAATPYSFKHISWHLLGKSCPWPPMPENGHWTCKFLEAPMQDPISRTTTWSDESKTRRKSKWRSNSMSKQHFVSSSSMSLRVRLWLCVRPQPCLWVHWEQIRTRNAEQFLLQASGCPRHLGHRSSHIAARDGQFFSHAHI